jgi:hypothetical protein
MISLLVWSVLSIAALIAALLLVLGWLLPTCDGPPEVHGA